MAETIRREFRTVAEMQAIPLDKIDAFCEDLRLWLTMMRLADAGLAEMPPELKDAIRLVSPRDVFGWIDDGKHDANIHIRIMDKRTPARAKRKP